MLAQFFFLNKKLDFPAKNRVLPPTFWDCSPKYTLTPNYPRNTTFWVLPNSKKKYPIQCGITPDLGNYPRNGITDHCSLLIRPAWDGWLEKKQECAFQSAAAKTGLALGICITLSHSLSAAAVVWQQLAIDQQHNHKW
jgi:hypothetical protein